MMSATTTPTESCGSSQLTMEQELGQLFNTISFIWQTHPTKFGCNSFDMFIKSLPFHYYHLLIQQTQLKLQQMQQQKQPQQGQQCKNMDNKPTLSSPLPSNPSTSSTPKSNIASIATKRVTKPLILAPKLETIDEVSTLSPCISCISSPEETSNALTTKSFPDLLCSEQTNITEQLKSARRYTKRSFIPAYAARANLNIYIPKHMTKKLLAAIDEKFPNTGTLYYYLDISTALQINDKQVDIIETAEGEKVSFINFDLHKKGTNELLYAVVISNDEHKIDGNKWLYKISEFLTMKEIQNIYDIDIADLPKSSRLMKNGLYSQWEAQQQAANNINISILNHVKWSDIKQIGSSQKGKKANNKPAIKITVNDNYWINECRKSWNDQYLTIIPIVVDENNSHCIEWVKLIYIEAQNAYIGISCKYDNNNNKWNVMSIYLDNGDIHNKHRLIGLNYNDQNIIDYDAYFAKFNTKISKIQWNNI